VTELSRYVLETLWEDGEFVMSRSVRDGDLSPLLVVAPSSAQPASGSLTRLEHAYALRDGLETSSEPNRFWTQRRLNIERT
jgi:hypothetical protein